ncbi:MAG TPA: hypothetical protein VLZ10_19505, partial [Thermodesulfobacteriota bacterium]|nr:hypothetical protein [Thermodesulfobacteriota bacterium]
MESRIKRSILVCLILSVSLFGSFGVLWSATPASEKESVKPSEVTKPSEPPKKAEKFVVKGREYCYECIDNSECLGCHTKISERKFAQSVHGANSCNSCHYDITDVKAHAKAKGARIHPEPVTCHRCHKKEGTEHYASAHFINDIQCKDCHKDIHAMTPWKGDKVRVIQTCTTCHSDDGYSQSVHGKAVIDGNPDSATCSDCHG